MLVHLGCRINNYLQFTHAGSKYDGPVIPGPWLLLIIREQAIAGFKITARAGDQQFTQALLKIIEKGLCRKSFCVASDLGDARGRLSV